MRSSSDRAPVVACRRAVRRRDAAGRRSANPTTSSSKSSPDSKRAGERVALHRPRPGARPRPRRRSSAAPGLRSVQPTRRAIAAPQSRRGSDRDFRGLFFGIATEALGRYKLRTSLSVLGVVLGVAAVIAMMSVSDGARREALTAGGSARSGQSRRADTGRVPAPSEARAARPDGGGRANACRRSCRWLGRRSPLIERYLRLSHAERSATTACWGVRPDFQTILRLEVGRGRFLSTTDERPVAPVCVLGAGLAAAVRLSRSARRPRARRASTTTR